MDTIIKDLEQSFSTEQKLMFMYKIKEKLINEKKVTKQKMTIEMFFKKEVFKCIYFVN